MLHAMLLTEAVCAGGLLGGRGRRTRGTRALQLDLQRFELLRDLVEVCLEVRSLCLLLSLQAAVGPLQLCCHAAQVRQRKPYCTSHLDNHP